MLTLTNVDSFYGRSHILQDVNLTAPAGRILTVLGRNGVGKTTLLKTMMGLTDSSRGEIRFNGNDLSNRPTFERARAGIAYVPQGREIIPEFTVAENIRMGGFANPRGRRAIPDIVPELFPYLADNMNRPGGLLSGGQQQQLAIARALAAEPTVLLMDEPTEGIQPNIVEQIEHTIEVLNRDMGLTIVLVEQNVTFARTASHTFAILEKGHVVATGGIEALTEDLMHRHLAV
jgi:urea transport system ATP-binding protein